MGLRLPHRGVNLPTLRADVASYLTHLWSDGRIERLVQQKMLQADAQHVRVTPQGQLVLNKIIEELLK